MRRFLFLSFAAMLFGIAGTFAQPDLNIVWEKDIWPTEIKFAKFSKNGEWIYCAVNNTIVKMNPTTGEFVSSFDTTGVSDIYDMEISELGNLIVTHDGGGAVNLWNTSTEKAYKRISLNTETNNESIIAVALSPTETELTLATIQRYGPNLTDVRTFIVKYDLIKDTILQRKNTDLRISKIKYSHNGEKFAIGGFTFGDNSHNRLELWSDDSLKQIATLEDVEGEADYKKFQFSNDGKYLGSLKNWKTKLFDLKTMEMKYFSGTTSDIFGFGIYPDSDYMIFYKSGIVELFDIPNFSLVRSIQKGNKIIESYKYNDNKILTFMGGYNYTTVLSNKTTGIIDQITKDFEISVNSSITISSQILFNNLKITDSTGKTVFTRDFSNNPVNNYSIENNFTSGTYICIITTQDGKTISKSFQVVR